MARILFFIGNGFDLNIGLKTGYKHFYRDFVKNHPDNIIAKEIEDKPEDWADLELALGQFTKKFTLENYMELINADEELELALSKYLADQEQSIDIKEGLSKEVADRFQKAVTGFYSDLPLQHRESIKTRIGKIGEPIYYSFVSFNYTNILDLIIEVCNNEYHKGISTHVSANTRYTDLLVEPTHIHGTLNEELILGVGDKNQIANEELANLEIIQQLFIKQATNDRFAQNKIRIVETMINQSVIICVYGMSIGNTDNYWWKYISNWLANSADRRLVIFEYNSEIHGNKSKFDFLHENRSKERFRETAEVDDNVWNSIKDRILIVFNTKIFSLPNIIKE